MDSFSQVHDAAVFMRLFIFNEMQTTVNAATFVRGVMDRAGVQEELRRGCAATAMLTAAGAAE